MSVCVCCDRKTTELITCDDCKGVQYCSTTCKERDAGLHYQFICDKTTKIVERATRDIHNAIMNYRLAQAVTSIKQLIGEELFTHIYNKFQAFIIVYQGRGLISQNELEAAINSKLFNTVLGINGGSAVVFQDGKDITVSAIEEEEDSIVSVSVCSYEDITKTILNLYKKYQVEVTACDDVFICSNIQVNTL